MKTLHAKLAALAVAALVITGIRLVSAAPAEAFAPITYVADCPTNEFNEDAMWQQLVVQNWSGSIIAVTAWEEYPNGQIKPLGTTAASQTGGQITYFTPMDGDVVRYDITGAGDLNFRYHVDCFY